MADENKPAFYPRVGNIKAKNFKSAKPAPFIDDERAMDLPQFGDLDLSKPTKANLEVSRRIAERDAALKRQQDADTSPLEKLAGGLQAGRFMGSALTQAINSMPTRIAKGDEAAEKFMQERMYKPTQPKAYEYAGDVADFLEQLETQYKIPPVLPEAIALQYLSGPAASQATKAVGKGAQKLEKRLDPMVTQALERGGLRRDLLMGLAQGSRSNVIKPKGGNWHGNMLDQTLARLKPYDSPTPEDKAWVAGQKAMWEAQADSDAKTRALRAINEDLAVQARNEAMNNWVDRNLTNYIRKEMATPEDPVRRLAEQGITHFPVAEDPRFWARRGNEAREAFGSEQMAKSDLAKQWENRSDTMISSDKAQEHQDMMHLAPGMYTQSDEYIKKLPPDSPLYRVNRTFNPADLGFDHILDVLREDVAAGRLRPDQLNKVSMEQAVRRTYEYDQEMAEQMRKTALKQQEGFPVHKEYPEGYKWLQLALPEPKIPEGSVFEEYNGMQRLFGPNGESLSVGATKEEATKLYKRQEREKQLEEALQYEGKTMGHCVGGYCPDVLKGNTRIFSLRDAKGEPHVTVEVQPNNYAPRWEAVKPYLEESKEQVIKDRMANNLPEATPDELEKLTQAYAYKKAKENQPANIVQIKGKQNAKPKEQYLPYVQDFVRSGKWSDVGDLKNTDLYFAHPEELGMYLPQAEDLKDLPVKRTDVFARAKQAGLFPENQNYLTRNEWEDILRKQYQSEQQAEAARKAQMSKPPSEGDIQGFIGGLEPEMKRGGKVSISNNPDTMMLELGNQKMKNGVPAYGAGKAVIKQGLKAAKPEIMKASEALGKIEGRPLKITQADRTKVGGGYLGGPGFSGLQLTEPEYRAAEAAWAVQNAGTAKTILGGEGDNAVYAAMLGTPTQHQSNQMVFDKLLGDFRKAAKRGELTPELQDLINMRLAAAVDKKGNPVFPANVDIMDKKFRDIADTFSRRSIAGHLMGGVQVGGKKGQIIDYDKIIRETTDPVLIDQPTGAIGNRLFTLSGGIVNRPDLHPAFPTILQGEDLGVMFTPVERDIIMKDFVEKTMREKGRKPGYMDYTRGNPPTQLITEDILTELQKLGKKKGGAVKKAEGGAITGDDLIIEERPL